MVALRKKGMKDRHWEQISEHIKFRINPSDYSDFTFDKVLKMGML